MTSLSPSAFVISFHIRTFAYTRTREGIRQRKKHDFGATSFSLHRRKAAARLRLQLRIYAVARSQKNVKKK